MALILIEGLDRTGKSTVAKYFEQQGYKVIHLSAPPKELSAPGYTGPSYLDIMVDVLQEAASKDVILDRTHYGELVWPQIYGRSPLLSEEDIDILREIEESIGVKRILMHDLNAEAHWQRCVDNKEPLTKVQFIRARSIYSSMAAKYGFEAVTLRQFYKEFPDSRPIVEEKDPKDDKVIEVPVVSTPSEVSTTSVLTKYEENPITLLDQANAINSILKKRLLKDKGPVFDQLEEQVRTFLLFKLKDIFGRNNTPSDEYFSEDEIKFYKTMYKKAIQKGDKR
jgi:hypothetical protein